MNTPSVTLNQAVQKLIAERRDGTRPAPWYPEPEPYVPLTAAELIEYLSCGEDMVDEYELDEGERQMICAALRLLIDKEQSV